MYGQSVTYNVGDAGFPAVYENAIMWRGVIFEAKI